ncbi:hypothetical protein FUA22_09000 [Seonamhaeicola maritimus]|uniref:Uncharacterized protein n=1 Tax=Seonamhaeicola maritimus TaxID=2591822 RepID=A0A5C7GH43_9FLAO|nr:hypothetical protein FUA22_09000 [Seonamhaeicola maritimus]
MKSIFFNIVINHFKILFPFFVTHFFGFAEIAYNVYVYEMLRVCVRGFSEGKSEASKQSNSHWFSTK